MRTGLIVARQIVKDWLLWVIVLVSIIMNSILLLSDPSGARMCQTANNMVEYYGEKVSSDNVFCIERDLNAILSKASNAYCERYGKANLDVSELYRAGFLGSEEYEKVVLMQRMQSCGQAALDDARRLKTFSVSELSDTRNTLYKKMLPIISAELVIIAVYVMLRTLETGVVTNTAPLEYATRSGRRVDIVKILTALTVISFSCLLVNICAITLFCWRYPGAVSATSTLPVLIWKASSVIDLSESAYLAWWLGIEFAVICIFAILAAAAGLAFRNSFVGFLTLCAYSCGLFGLQTVSFDKFSFWEELAQWNPVGLFLIFKEGAVEVQSEKWFLVQESGYVLCGSELPVVATWLAFSLAVLGMVWRFFKRKETAI